MRTPICREDSSGPIESPSLLTHPCLHICLHRQMFRLPFAPFPNLISVSQLAALPFSLLFHLIPLPISSLIGFPLLIVPLTVQQPFPLHFMSNSVPNGPICPSNPFHLSGSHQQLGISFRTFLFVFQMLETIKTSDRPQWTKRFRDWETVVRHLFTTLSISTIPTIKAFNRFQYRMFHPFASPYPLLPPRRLDINLLLSSSIK